MSEIEKMQRYIAKIKKPFNGNRRYDMNIQEAFALAEKAKNNDSDFPTFDTVCLAFEYGRAKGYRAAKAEVRR